MAALTTLFNALALNLAMIVASLPLITAPAAVSAASAALDRWARTARTGSSASSSPSSVTCWSARVALGVGGPLMRRCARPGRGPALRPRGDARPGRAGLCLAGGALLITLTALGYVFQLSADEPGLTPVDLWSLAARLALRNLPVAGPLSGRACRGLTLLAARDPAVLLLGLPLFLLHALKLLARPGLRRAAEPSDNLGANRLLAELDAQGNAEGLVA